MSDRGYEYLDELEAEAIYILRDAVAQAKRPVLLFSIGKDSCALLHLARKAFHPGPLPFPVLHVDTKWKFREMIEFRDSEAKRLGFHLIVHTNPDGLREGINPIKHGSRIHTEIMKTLALRQALDAGGYDCVFGEHAATRKRAGRRSVFFPTATPFISGSLVTSVPSFGSSTTVGCPKAKACGCSR